MRQVGIVDAATRPGADPLRSTSPLSDLGPALRRLRMGKGRRQFETAEAHYAAAKAGIEGLANNVVYTYAPGEQAKSE